MFSENYSSSAVGAYKITNLSCSIDSAEINNQQTYGFSVTVPGRLVKINSENISFNWEVLDPQTNAQANLNDGVFSYFTVQLVDRNNSVVTVLNPVLKETFFNFNVSVLSTLSSNIFADENYLRDCRILITSYNTAGQTSQAFFALDFKTPFFQNVNFDLNNGIFCNYDLQQQEYARKVIFEKSTSPSFGIVDDSVTSDLGSSVYLNVPDFTKYYYRLNVIDYYNTGQSYFIGQIKPSPINTNIYDIKPLNLTGAIVVNYDEVAKNYERFLFLKWAINSSNVPLDYEIHIIPSGSSGIHKVYEYSAPTLENIQFIGFGTGTQALVNASSGINPYYSGSGYTPIFSVNSGGSGIKWNAHTVYLDSKGAFPSGVYTGDVDDLLY